MDYIYFINKDRQIQKEYGDCESMYHENYQALTQELKESLQNKSLQEYSKYFSQLFDIWLVAMATTRSIHIFPFNDKNLDEKYKIYREQTTFFENKEQEMPIAAAPPDLPKSDSKESLSENKRKQTVAKLLNFSSIRVKDLYESKKIIEDGLNELWLCIFQKKLSFLSLNSEDDNNKKECSEIDEYFHKNWPLYELINQISRTIYQVGEDGKNQKTKITNLKEFEKNNLIENTEQVCQYILETYILDSKHTLDLFAAKRKNSSINWFPKLETSKEILLPHIIATSDLVSYIFEYKLMSPRLKNEHLKKVKKNVVDIYNKLIQGNILYDAIDSYLNYNKEEDIIVTKYKAHILCPKIVFIFVISIIQEVIRKILTQSRNNIFHNILNQKRDKGFDKDAILTKINKDVKSYMLIYRYYDNPVSQTLKKKEQQLNTWVIELNKLRYGVLDDYLFDLAEAAQISFKETTETSINTQKKGTLA